jgi:hypothetical protein
MSRAQPTKTGAHATAGDPGPDEAGPNVLVRAVLWVWDFVVGDDWVAAAGVIVGLGLTAAIAGTGASAWWVMPVAIVALLAISLRRAAG